LLRFTRDFSLAVVEAKASHKSATDAVQQARSYAEILVLKYAYPPLSMSMTSSVSNGTWRF
jgi:type I restriction enzyme R subunit